MRVKATMVGLLGIAAGIMIQKLAGDPTYPTMPPGVVVLAAAAAVVYAGRRWWWITLPASLLALFITFGAIVTPYTARRLRNPAAVGIFLGTIIQVAALLFTSVSGIVEAVGSYRRAS